MNEDLNVFELDTNDLMLSVETALEARGFEVLEQVPAGVWWLKTDTDTVATAEEVAAVFKSCLTVLLRKVEQ
ncbi:MAG: hypothetical protein NVSMB52_02160 [Chloroflexota bacterium]